MLRNIKYPIYLPDATRAVTKGIDSNDLLNAGVEGVVVNTYHLSSPPGQDYLKNNGGVKRLMNFNGLVVSDSGGWQVFSLIHRSKTQGKITDEGVVFSIGNSKNSLFTPQESINMRLAIGSDIVVCLDDFSPPDASTSTLKTTVDRTIKWAKTSREYFDLRLRELELPFDSRPKIMAVIQGGWDKNLRKECAERLIEIGFDAYGFGGYVVNEETHELDLDISKFIAELIPEDKIRFALGTGKAYEIANLHEMGWQIFDCTLPTRDARHKRLYTFKSRPDSLSKLKDKDNYEFLYISRGRYSEDFGPIDEFCDCHTCRNYSRAYLNHLFKIGDFSAFRLASIHNLRHYTMVTDALRSISR